ncbi:MAG TPA: hypothetical protein VKM93_25490 [Terriglobia bacterium]|nr:hypothetical protein [Terriglobia bacterium]
MKKRSNAHLADDLRPEYDFLALPVVARGPGRKAPPPTVQLAEDVARAFPDSQSVNEALRFLIRVTEGRVKQTQH